MTKANVIAIMGPTAAGKTAAALEIAKHIPAEIISVDSALVNSDMDIGTAKPSAEELASAPHHLIDIIDPAESYSVAQFRKDTERLVKEIQARGKLPILVGGTMMYFNALKQGLDDLPGADPAVRAELDAEAERIGVPGLHARLAEIDPETAARLKPNDSQRIQRALEIYAISGETMTTRIALRFDLMLENGFIDEVAALKQRPDLHANLPSIRCVGYRQAWDYLDQQCHYDDMRERGIIATRQLAKRQLTCLRSMPERIVIDCLSHNPPQQILQLAKEHLHLPE